APAGVAAFRSGDLIARLVSDVDSLADRWLRVRLPYAAAAGCGAAAAAVAAPLLAGLIARRAERQLAPRRGEFAAATVDLLRGAGELSVFGPPQRALAEVAGKNRQV